MQKLHSGRLTRDVDVARTMIVFGASLALFLGISLAVALSDAVTAADVDIDAWLHARATPLATRVMAAISFVGAPTTLSAVAVAGSLLLLYRRMLSQAVTLSAVVLGGNLLNVSLKHLIGRGRPVFDDPLFTLPTYSFPSGHAMASTVFYGMIAMHASAIAPRGRSASAAAGAAALVVALVSFSRLYLGLHYLSDVLGGIIEGIGWLAFSLIALHFVQRRDAGPDADPHR